MKDAKGHGSAAHQSGVEALPRVIKNADDQTLVDISRWQRGSMANVLAKHASEQGELTRAPAWVERFGLAARKGRSPV